MHCPDPAAGGHLPELLVALDREARAWVLLGQLRELLEAARAGAVPGLDDLELYAARVEGAVAAVEAVLGVPSALTL
jgi:hypothetical protein